MGSAILWHTLAHSCILWHTLAYSGILWHTLAYSGILWHTLAYSDLLLHTLAYSESYIKAITGLYVLASWMPHGFDWASLMMTWGHLGHNLWTPWALHGDDLGTTLAKLGKTLAYSGT